MTRTRITTRIAALLAVVALSACATTTTAEQQDQPTTSAAASASTAATESGTDRDSTEALTVDEPSGDEVTVTLSDGASTVTGDGASVDGDVITITASGTYRISGTLSDGQLVVDAGDDDVVTLVLDEAVIASSTSSAIVVANAGDVVVWLDAGTTNTVADGSDYVDTADTTESDTDVPNAALFSTTSMTIAGDGTLVVTGNANDGITSKDDLVIASGTIEVTAADDGIRGKDSVTVRSGTIDVEAGGDAISADNEISTDTTASDDAAGTITISGGTLDLTSGVDGIDAVGTITVDGGQLTIASGDDALHADAAISISGGTIDITESYEGIEGAVITIAGGEIHLVASDDGLNVAGGNDASGTRAGGMGGAPGQDSFADSGEYYAEITGGTITVDAGGDGIDVNGSITISGGTIEVSGPIDNGNAALDVDGSFEVTGATVLAAGSSGMAQAPTSGQPVLSVSFNGSIGAGTLVQIVADSGDLLAEYTSAKPFSSLVFTSPALAAGTDYTIVLDGEAAGSVTSSA